MADVVIVTGGSRGIGAATARLAADRGWDIAIGYRVQEAEAQRVVVDCIASGRRAVAVRADVSTEGGVLQLFETVTAQLGPIHGLVNNAGIVLGQMRVEAMTGDRIERMLAVNLLGPFLCCREAVRRMSRRNGGDGGSIVNVSSRAAVLGSPNEYVDYAAAKAGIDTLTVGLAKEVAVDGIRVNAVRPGLIRTDIHASGGEPGRVERIQESIPLHRGGEPAEVAAAIVWLLSDEASYITGGLLDVSGGR